MRDLLIELTKDRTLPKGYDTWGIRSVRPDFSSRNGYVWPFPGRVAKAAGPRNMMNAGGCPSGLDGDGICVASSWSGMASGSIPAITLLLVAYKQSDVWGFEGHKCRVGYAKVIAVIDGARLLRENGYGANLSGADLTGANLTGANLSYAHFSHANFYCADLSHADLSHANFYCADLSHADLSGANLYGANLYGANLSGADLTGANLSYAHFSYAHFSHANLYGANLSHADLSHANFYCANLSGANLYGANLYCADLGNWKLLPSGFVESKTS